MYTNHTAQHNSNRTFPRLPVTNLDALPERDIQILRPGILAEGYSHQIVAPYGSGKTFLALVCAKEYVNNGLTVLYMDHENRASSIKERRDLLRTDYAEMGKLLYVNLPNLDLSEDSRMQYIAFLEHHRPSLIVFDSLNGFLSGAGRDENSSTGFQEWANVYLKFARAMGITTLVIDHTGWDGTHSRGTSRKPDEFDIVWNVKVKKKFSRSVKGEIQLKTKKDRDSAISENCLDVVIGGTPFQLEVTAASDPHNDLSDKAWRAYQLIAKNSRNGVGTRRKEINELFNGSKATADNAIKALLRVSKIYQDEESKQYWTLDSSTEVSSKNTESSNQDSDQDSSESRLVGEGVPGSGPKGPGPLDPTPDTCPQNSLNEDHSENPIERTENGTDPKVQEISDELPRVETPIVVNENNIMEAIDTLDSNPRGREVLKTVASVFLNNPLLMLNSDEKAARINANRAFALAKQDGIEIDLDDLVRALRVLDDNFSFVEMVREKISDIFEGKSPIPNDEAGNW
jgi:hypothetical protein